MNDRLCMKPREYAQLGLQGELCARITMELWSVFGSVESEECGDFSEKSAKHLYCRRYELYKLNASCFFFLYTSAI